MLSPEPRGQGKVPSRLCRSAWTPILRWIIIDIFWCKEDEQSCTDMLCCIRSTVLTMLYELYIVILVNIFSLSRKQWSDNSPGLPEHAYVLPWNSCITQNALWQWNPVHSSTPGSLCSRPSFFLQCLAKWQPKRQDPFPSAAANCEVAYR